MSALDLLAAVRAAGGTFKIAGDRLRVEASAPLSDDLLARLRQAKAEVMAALATDWRRLYCEAIAEYRTAGHAWNKAALAWYVARGTPTLGDLCAGCGKPLAGTEIIDLWPHGERAHAGGDYKCILAYGRRWRRAAAAALAPYGIPTPAEIEAELHGKEDDGRAA
jgi:hypothetical protein